MNSCILVPKYRNENESISYIIYKTVKGKRYAYEATAYWDAARQQSRRQTRYLGAVDENNSLISKKAHRTEKLLLDFGDGYLLTEFIKKLFIFPLINSLIAVKYPEIISLICYKLCLSSAMYNCRTWFESNVISVLNKPLNLSSQHISRLLSFLGSEKIQQAFFQNYLKLIGHSRRSVIIDATSLPNQIQTGFNAWGYSDSHIEKQFRFLCVVDQKQPIPLFYRYLPGNVCDVSTLHNTIIELTNQGVHVVFALIDSGYFSEINIKELYRANINFLTRLPASRLLYKNIIKHHVYDIEHIEHAVNYNKRVLFIKKISIPLYDYKAYAYIVLDPLRKSKELTEKVNHYLQLNDDEKNDQRTAFNLNRCGILVLISSKSIPTVNVVSSYYLRQSVEQVFGFMKDDLGLLPIRRQTDETVRGYLFLQFLVLIIFIQLRKKLLNHYTLEQALLHLRALKCRLFDDHLLVAELTKHQKQLFKLFDILVPKTLGI